MVSIVWCGMSRWAAPHVEAIPSRRLTTPENRQTARRLLVAILLGSSLTACQTVHEEQAGTVLKRGIASASRGDFHEAITAYDRVLTLQPTKPRHSICAAYRGTALGSQP